MNKPIDLYNYLKNEMREGKIDFHVHANDAGDGVIEFHIHPTNASGDTMDFSIIRYEDGECILIKKPTASPC